MSWPNEHRVTSRAAREAWSQNSKAFWESEGRHAKGYPESEDLRRAVVENPDDDAPRWAYATWMRQQEDTLAAEIGEFVESELRIAQAFRADPRADVSALRRFPPSDPHGDLFQLMSEGLVGWPGRARGFVEHVAVRAHRLFEIADELFSLAPIRQLTLLGVPAVVDELAAWPQLARIRSLEFCVLGPEDELTDDVLARLLTSPYLHRVAYLEMIRQPRLTPRAYEQVVTATTLPSLSYFHVDTGGVTCWAEPIRTDREPGTLTYFDRVMDKPPARGDLRVTPTPVVLRPEDWIVELERKIGYVPCVHPEEHYGRYNAELEAAIEHPIALDPAIMQRRGQPVVDPGPKPSLMERRANGLCAICGSDRFERQPGHGDPYSDPMGAAGILACRRCGTRWYEDQWREREP